MQVVNLPLIGNLTVRNALSSGTVSLAKGQAFTNCEFFTFDNPFTQSKSIKVAKRQGYRANGSIGGYTAVEDLWPWWSYNGGQGTIVYTGYAANTVMGIGGPVTHTFGSVSRIIHVTESRNSSGTDSILIGRIGGDYYIYPRGGVVSSITVPANSVGPMVTMKGWTFIANKDGKIYNSTLNDPTSGYSDFISADLFPDGLTYLIPYKNYLFAFGPASMEGFEVVENTTGSPLRYVPSMHRQIGINSAEANVHCFGNDSVFFIGSNPERNLFKMTSNYDVKPMLSPYLVDLYPGAPKFCRWGYRNKLILPKTIYEDGVSASNGALVYDFDLNFWHTWISTSINFNCVCTQPSSAFPGSKLIYSSDGDGDVYSEPSYAAFSYLDGGGAVRRTIITSPIDFGTNKYKVINYIKIIGDIATASSTVSVSWSDDDGQTFNTTQTIDLSSSNPVLWGCGVTRRRIFKLEETLNGEFRLESIEIGYNEGNN